MNNEQRDVRDFHRKMGQPAPDGLAPIYDSPTMARMDMLQEEVDELEQALYWGDHKAVAHECVDVLYTVYGTAVQFGIDLEDAWRAVHAANMKKEPGPDGGKAVKPHGWQAPVFTVRSGIRKQGHAIRGIMFSALFAAIVLLAGVGAYYLVVTS